MEPRVMWSDLDAAANCSEATFGVDFGKTGESTIVTSGSVRVKILYRKCLKTLFSLNDNFLKVSLSSSCEISRETRCAIFRCDTMLVTIFVRKILFVGRGHPSQKSTEEIVKYRLYFGSLLACKEPLAMAKENLSMGVFTNA